MARVRRTWITSLLPTICDFQDVPLRGCPDEGGHSDQARIVLVDNALLESKFSDRARVRRIVGDLWFQPTWDGTTPDDCATNFAAVISAYGQAFAGLRRFSVNGAGIALNVDPLAPGATGDFDYSEAEWLRTWQHSWWPTGEVNHIAPWTFKNCSATVCADVHTSGALDNDFVDGTGTINIETTCNDPVVVSCDSLQDEACNSSFRYPGTWHLHLDVKKRIPMREDQQLGLDLSFLWPAASTGFLTNPRMTFWGGIKTLLEF